MSELRRLLRGILTEVKPMKKGYLFVEDEAAWEAFRAEHGLMVGRRMGECSREDLPSWPEDAGRLLVFWAGRSVNDLEAREHSAERFAIYEAEPPHAGDICQPIFVGVCEVWVLPPGARPDFSWLS